jgi:hypothetical protein
MAITKLLSFDFSSFINTNIHKWFLTALWLLELRQLVTPVGHASLTVTPVDTNIYI